jgi:alkanesulfonate monooxygenase SsuD/methylene tetrahydromethanopterin reductase-like flavin-dependent oxidoreductase (luciferase family)
VETLKMLPRMWTEETFSWDGMLKVPPRSIVPKPLQKPHPPMWMAATQPWSVEFAGDNGLGLLGFGISDKSKDDMLQLYRQRIANCTPIGSFVNNQFALMRVGLCCDTDEEALQIQGPNYYLFHEQLEAVNSIWRFTDEVPRTYEYASERAKRNMHAKQSFDDIVAAGGAVVGSPSTCQRILEGAAESGVDEVILFMQGATTPHDVVMKSMRMIAEKVMPKLA